MACKTEAKTKYAKGAKGSFRQRLREEPRINKRKECISGSLRGKAASTCTFFSVRNFDLKTYSDDRENELSCMIKWISKVLM